MDDRGQVIASAAEVYDAFFVPALFAEWPSRVIAAAGLRPGMRVLDVACGTGVLAIAAETAVSPGGAVEALDLNPGMLAMARGKAPHIEWHQGPAESLPFDAGHFDAVISQFGLMFFEDRVAALRETLRVLRPGGRMAFAVWDALELAPGYAAVVSLLGRLFGDPIADLLRTPYSLGDTARLRALFEAAGAGEIDISRHPGTARFPSIRSWMHTDVRGWTLADRLDDQQFERLVSEAEVELGRFAAPDGTVSFRHPAIIVSATQRATVRGDAHSQSCAWK